MYINMHIKSFLAFCFVCFSAKSGFTQSRIVDPSGYSFVYTANDTLITTRSLSAEGTPDFSPIDYVGKVRMSVFNFSDDGIHTLGYTDISSTTWIEYVEVAQDGYVLHGLDRNADQDSFSYNRFYINHKFKVIDSVKVSIENPYVGLPVFVHFVTAVNRISPSEVLVTIGAATIGIPRMPLRTHYIRGDSLVSIHEVPYIGALDITKYQPWRGRMIHAEDSQMIFSKKLTLGTNQVNRHVRLAITGVQAEVPQARRNAYDCPHGLHIMPTQTVG